eukprot:gene3884-biopygen3806
MIHQKPYVHPAPFRGSSSSTRYGKAGREGMIRLQMVAAAHIAELGDAATNSSCRLSERKPKRRSAASVVFISL